MPRTSLPRVDDAAHDQSSEEGSSDDADSVAVTEAAESGEGKLMLAKLASLQRDLDVVIRNQGSLLSLLQHLPLRADTGAPASSPKERRTTLKHMKQGNADDADEDQQHDRFDLTEPQQEQLLAILGLFSKVGAVAVNGLVCEVLTSARTLSTHQVLYAVIKAACVLGYGDEEEFAEADSDNSLTEYIEKALASFPRVLSATTAFWRNLRAQYIMPAWRAEAIKAAIGEGLAMAQEDFAKQETLLNAAGLWKPGPPGSLQMVSQESAFFDGAATLDFMAAHSPLDKLVDALVALYLPEEEDDPPIELIAMSMVLLQDLCKVVQRRRSKKRQEEPFQLDESEDASAAAPAVELLQYAKARDHDQWGERARSMLLFLADPLLCRSSNPVIKAYQEAEAAKKAKALKKKKKKAKRRADKENADAPCRKGAKKKGVEGR